MERGRPPRLTTRGPLVTDGRDDASAEMPAQWDQRADVGEGEGHAGGRRRCPEREGGGGQPWGSRRDGPSIRMVVH
jgi:hypothetical protein